jgi:hypothetical protein
MSRKDLTVLCHAWAPKQQTKPHTVSRVLCTLHAYEHCPRCPNSRFVLHIPFLVGEQLVACPRWGEEARAEGGDPIRYVMIRRETCLRSSPFEFCPSCPNSRPDISPLSDPGWYERGFK